MVTFDLSGAVGNFEKSFPVDPPVCTKGPLTYCVKGNDDVKTASFDFWEVVAKTVNVHESEKPITDVRLRDGVISGPVRAPHYTNLSLGKKIRHCRVIRFRSRLHPYLPRGSTIREAEEVCET